MQCEYIDKSNLPQRLFCAKQANTPARVLEQLAEDDDWHVRQEVAANLSTPSNILQSLALDKETNEWNRIKINVAENLHTPVKTLELLATDPSRQVRAGVASNENTPVRLLRKLARDKEEHVRFFVVTNIKTPTILLKKLSKGKRTMVSSQAKEEIFERSPNLLTEFEKMQVARDNLEFEIKKIGRTGNKSINESIFTDPDFLDY